MLKLINRFKDLNYLKLLTAAFLLTVPLYPKFPLLRVPLTYVSIRAEDFLLAIIFISVFIYFVPKIKELLSGRVEKAMFLFLAVGLLSLLSAVFITKSVDFSVSFFHWFRRFEYFVPYFLAVLLFRGVKKDTVDYILKLVFIVILIVFIYGFGQKYFSWPVIITQNQEYSKGIALKWVQGSHINSSFAGHYDLATFLVLMMPFLVSLFFLLNKIKQKVIVFVLIGFCYWLLSNSISRISVVSTVIGVCVSLFILKKYKEIALFVVFSVLVFGLSSDLRSRYLRIIQVVEPKIRKIILIPYPKVAYAAEEEVFEDRSSSIRLNVEWPRAIRAFVKNPLLGTGYSSITLATDNDYLRLLGELGIMGFVSFGLIISNIFLTSIKAFKRILIFDYLERIFIAGYIGGFVGILINALFIDIFEASKFALIFWFFTGIFIECINYNIGKNNNV